MRGSIVDAMGRLEHDAHRRRLLTVMLQRCEYVDEMAPALGRRLKADAKMRGLLQNCFEVAASRGEMTCLWTPEQSAMFLHALIGGLINDWLRADGGFSLSQEVDRALGVFFACLGVALPQVMPTHA
jgi:hypothetical protein